MLSARDYHFVQYGANRLLQLAQHLETGALFHATFDFNVLHAFVDGCGYVGCAMGEMPAIFPEYFMFSPKDELCPTDCKLRRPCDGVELPYVDEYIAGFFGITRNEEQEGSDEFWALFYPDNPRQWSHRILGSDATREQVSESIREFVAWKLSGLDLTGVLEALVASQQYEVNSWANYPDLLRQLSWQES